MQVNDKLLEKLFGALNDIVRAEGSWQEKRDAILAKCDEHDETNLHEFVGWFDETN